MPATVVRFSLVFMGLALRINQAMFQDSKVECEQTSDYGKIGKSASQAALDTS